MKFRLTYPLANPVIFQKFAENAISLYKELKMTGHNGLDLYAPDGTPVMASHDGVVTYAGLDGANGNLIVIKTNEQFDYLDKQSYYKTLYGHLKTGTYLVTAGQKVTRGMVMALADNTGASTGSHLHFGLKPVYQGEEDWQWFNHEQNNGYNGAIDPLPYLEDRLEFRTALKKGDTGFEVEKLQRYLITKGYMNPIDKLGYYGNLTSGSLLKFQIAKCTLSWYERYVLRGTVCGNKSLKALNLYT